MPKRLIPSRTQPAVAATLATCLALALAGCGQSSEAGPGAQAGAAVAVSVVTAQAETLPVTLEYTAQTQGSREVEVRARVTGLLHQRNFIEGARVKAGQSLFSIDPAPFANALARSEADLAAAAARHAQAARDAARLAPLVDTKAISRKDYDDALSAEAIAAADLLSAKVRVREATLNLEWTRVESPISGVTSRALKSEGSLISGPDVLLTTVTQADPIQVIFGIPDNERLTLRQEADGKRLQLPAGGRFKVTVKLADGSVYARTGVTDFTDLRVSAQTGTSEARAELPNPDGLLQPGQFVRVRLDGATRAGVFRIPQRAVLEGPQGKFVFIVGKDSKAEMRPVEAGEWNGGDVVVSRGLTAGEQVVVDGVLKLGPGAPLQATALKPAAPDAQPAATPNAKHGG